MSDQEPPEDPEGSQDPEDSDVLEEPIDPEEKSSVKSDSVSEDEHTEALKGILDEMDGDQTPRLSSEGRVVKEPSFVGADTAVKAGLPKTISAKKEGPTKPSESLPSPSNGS